MNMLYISASAANQTAGATVSLTPLKFCQNFLIDATLMSDRMFTLAFAAFVIAGLLATISGLISLLEKFRDLLHSEATAGEEAVGGRRRISATMIEALAKMVDALAKGPSWIFLFFAGLMLVLFAPLETPAVCNGIFQIPTTAQK